VRRARPWTACSTSSRYPAKRHSATVTEEEEKPGIGELLTTERPGIGELLATVAGIVVAVPVVLGSVPLGGIVFASRAASRRPRGDGCTGSCPSSSSRSTPRVGIRPAARGRQLFNEPPRSSRRVRVRAVSYEPRRASPRARTRPRGRASRSIASGAVHATRPGTARSRRRAVRRRRRASGEAARDAHGTDLVHPARKARDDDDRDGRDGRVAPRMRRNSMPSIHGMKRSSTMRLALRPSRRARRASSPSLARTTKYPSTSSAATMAAATSSSSSTRRMLLRRSAIRAHLPQSSRS